MIFCESCKISENSCFLGHSGLTSLASSLLLVCFPALVNDYKSVTYKIRFNGGGLEGVDGLRQTVQGRFFGRFALIPVFQGQYLVYEKYPVCDFALIFCLVFGNPVAFVVDPY